MAKNYSLGGVINELREIEKINGATRKVYVTIEGTNSDTGKDVSEYGARINKKPSYHFSDGDGTIYEDIHNSDIIKRSVSKLSSVSGKRKKRFRRREKELDKISIVMAQKAVKNIRTFIKNGGNHVYQYWKKSNEKNLWETGSLYNSIYGVVTKKNDIIYKGRRMK